jgi:hypothetical protein
MTMTPALAARRLSGALGVKVVPDDIAHISDDDAMVTTTGGDVYAVAAGNAAYKAGTGEWFRNGKPWQAVDGVRPPG